MGLKDDYWREEMRKDEEEIKEMQLRMANSTDPRVSKECELIIEICQTHIMACVQQIRGY